MVKRDESPAFTGAHFEQPLVSSSFQALIANGGDVVTSRPQELLATASYVLVELELHADAATGTGTIRSRETSAP